MAAIRPDASEVPSRGTGRRSGARQRAVHGPGEIVEEPLLERELLDELALLVHPLVVGSGDRLFPDGTPTGPLELVESATFSTGVVSLRYRPA